MSLTAEIEDTHTEIIEATGDWPLIGPHDPPPCSIYRPQGEAPFLLVCDHASRAFPREMNQLGVEDWVLDRHVAWDIGSGGVARALADRFDAPLVLAGYSRLVMDLNRAPDDPAAFLPVSDGIPVPGNADLDEEHRRLRKASFFDPYHGAIRKRLAGFRERGQVPALISIHTCTPVFDGIARKWHIGVMWDRDPRIARPLLSALAGIPDLCVGDNEPYSGQLPNDFTIDHHGERDGLPCVGVEVRQDLVATDDGIALWAGLLGDALDKALSEPDLFTRVETA